MVLAEDLTGVLVMDINLSGAAGLVQPFPDDVDLDLVNCFAATDFQAHPDVQDLLAQVRSWLGSEPGDRVAFYSIEEEVLPTTPRKRTPRARTTTLGGSTGPGKVPSGAKLTSLQ